MPQSNWQRVGHIDVDAGLCWVGDPCYILHAQGENAPTEIGKNWREFCDILPLEGAALEQCKAFGHRPGETGLGVCVPTGYGDGSYPVYVKVKEGRVAAVMVDFEGDQESL